MNGSQRKTKARNAAVPTAVLTIAGEEEVREVLLEPKGVVVGRSVKCDVVLKSERVSRRHARIFQDPFGRWIIEDLGSQNGVLIGGKRVQAHAVLPGEKIAIGPFLLTLSQPIEQEIPADSSISTTTTLIEPKADVEVVREGAAAEAAPLSRVWLQELNRIVDTLAGLTSPSELYPEVCRCVATAPGTAALVVRLVADDKGQPTSPEILAYHLGGRPASPSPPEVASLHLSRRVLEAVRASGQPVMAKSVHSTDDRLTLTITDERVPRAVLCAPVSEPKESVDAFYVDIPFDQVATEIFDFVQAVARQVQLVRKSLLLLELRAQRQLLDQQLEMARGIQARLSPGQLPDVPGVDVAIHYAPALWVGGDYCDIWQMPDGRLAFAVGDVAGKGLPAAMVMANLQAALRTATSFCTDCAALIGHVNSHLRQHLPPNVFVTLFFGLFDAQAGRLEFVNAGHIPPLLLAAPRRVVSLEHPRGTVLGFAQEGFTAGIASVEPDVSLLVVSDGVTEALSPGDEQFGPERLAQLLRTARPRSARQLVKAVTTAISDFRGSRPQQDDVTVFALVRRRSAY